MLIITAQVLPLFKARFSYPLSPASVAGQLPAILVFADSPLAAQ